MFPVQLDERLYSELSGGAGVVWVPPGFLGEATLGACGASNYTAGLREGFCYGNPACLVPVQFGGSSLAGRGMGVELRGARLGIGA